MAKGSGGTRSMTNRLSPSQYIAKVINDKKKQGYSKLKPKKIGETESRMIDFAIQHDIEISNEGLYLTADRIMHAQRDAKIEKGLSVSEEDMIRFPTLYKKMDLYYDKNKGVFAYTDGRRVKFIVHPNYQIKTQSGKIKVVNLITASKTDGEEFHQRNYVKVETSTSGGTRIHS